jgi:hypothetical protein
LAEAVTLAREEFGITITSKDPSSLVPGGGKFDPAEQFSELNKRIPKSSVAVCQINYPKEVEFPAGKKGKTGTLIFAKAVLTPDMPYDVLAYAQSQHGFPRDSTSDQWFDHGQFDSYHELGRSMDEAASRAAIPKGPFLRRLLRLGTTRRGGKIPPVWSP